MNEQGERILKELENIAVAVEGISGMLGDWIEANGDSITELPEEVRQELQIAGWQGSMAEGGGKSVLNYFSFYSSLQYSYYFFIGLYVHTSSPRYV